MDEMVKAEIRERNRILVDYVVEHRIQSARWARMVRTYYNNLIKAGFNENQALSIVLKHGIQPDTPNKPNP